MSEKNILALVTVAGVVTIVRFDSYEAAWNEVRRFNEYVARHSSEQADARVIEASGIEEFEGNLTDWIGDSAQRDMVRLEEAGWERAGGDWYKPGDTTEMIVPHSLSNALDALASGDDD